MYKFLTKNINPQIIRLISVFFILIILCLQNTSNAMSTIYPAKWYIIKSDGTQMKESGSRLSDDIREIGNGIIIKENNSYYFYDKTSKQYGEHGKIIDASVINRFNYDSVILGEWAYFVSREDPHLSEMRKIKLDGTEESKLFEAELLSIEGVLGDNIYYYYMLNEVGRYSKISLDSSKEINIIEGKKLAIKGIYDNYIYYLNEVKGEYGLKKISVDAKSKINLFKTKNDIVMIQISNNKIYFVEAIYKGNNIYNYKICKTDIDGTNRKELISLNGQSLNVWISEFLVRDDWIYYFLGDKKLYRLKTNGTQNEKILEGYLDPNNIEGDWFCYIEGTENERIYKSKLDGTNKTQLIDSSQIEKIVGAKQSMFEVKVFKDLIYFRIQPPNNNDVTVYENPLESDYQKLVEGIKVIVIISIFMPFLIFIKRKNRAKKMMVYCLITVIILALMGCFLLNIIISLFKP